jgi:hypothetical protein
MGLRQAHDPGRAPTQAPACPRKDAARARPRTREAREPGEEAGAGHQEECQEWTDGCGQSPSQGSCEDETIYPEILPDEDAVASHLAADTGEDDDYVLWQVSVEIADLVWHRRSAATSR